MNGSRTYLEDRAHFLANGTKGEFRTFLAKCDFGTFQTKLVENIQIKIDQLNI